MYSVLNVVNNSAKGYTTLETSCLVLGSDADGCDRQVKYCDEKKLNIHFEQNT